MRCRFLPWVLFGLLAAALFVATSAAAQDPADSTPAVVEGGLDVRTTEGVIDRVSSTLLVVAASASLLLLIYIWHTDPHRRVRVATRRREASGRHGPEDNFMLPGEVDAVAIDDGIDPDEQATVTT